MGFMKRSRLAIAAVPVLALASYFVYHRNEVPKPVIIEKRISEPTPVVSQSVVPKPPYTKSPLEILASHALAIPVGEVDENKPFFFYVGQEHVSNKDNILEYKGNAAEAQTHIYRLLIDLNNAQMLNAVFDEGYYGVMEVSTEDSQKLLQATKKYDLTELIRQNPRIDGAIYFLATSNRSQAYGWLSKRSSNLVENFYTEIEPKVRIWQRSREFAVNNNINLTITRTDLGEIETALAAAIKVRPLLTEDSVYETLRRVNQEKISGNVAIVAGLAHLFDVQEGVAKGKYKELTNKYNVVFTIPKSHSENLDKLRSYLHKTHDLLGQDLEMVKAILAEMDSAGMKEASFRIRRR